MGGPIIKTGCTTSSTRARNLHDAQFCSAGPGSCKDSNNQPASTIDELAPGRTCAQFMPVQWPTIQGPAPEHLFFGKLDWAVSDNDRLELSGKYRRERQQAGSAGVVAAVRGLDLRQRRQALASAAGSTRSGNIFNEATVTYEKTTDSAVEDERHAGPAVRGPGHGGEQRAFDPILQINGVDPLAITSSRRSTAIPCRTT